MTGYATSLCSKRRPRNTLWPQGAAPDICYGDPAFPHLPYRLPRSTAPAPPAAAARPRPARPTSPSSCTTYEKCCTTWLSYRPCPPCCTWAAWRWRAALLRRRWSGWRRRCCPRSWAGRTRGGMRLDPCGTHSWGSTGRGGRTANWSTRRWHGWSFCRCGLVQAHAPGPKRILPVAVMPLTSASCAQQVYTHGGFTVPPQAFQQEMRSRWQLIPALYPPPVLPVPAPQPLLPDNWIMQRHFGQLGPAFDWQVPWATHPMAMAAWQKLLEAARVGEYVRMHVPHGTEPWQGQHMVAFVAQCGLRWAHQPAACSVRPCTQASPKHQLSCVKPLRAAPLLRKPPLTLVALRCPAIAERL